MTSFVMGFNWHHRVGLITLIYIVLNVTGKQSLYSTDPSDWKIVEDLAERHPYIVALLSKAKKYRCTGIVLHKYAVLTSGSCLDTYPPCYIVSGLAVIPKKIKTSSLSKVRTTILHGDYTFEKKVDEPNSSAVHSNIGLVISTKPTLITIFPGAEIGNVFTSALHGKELKLVGYGVVNETGLVMLQYQMYRQTPCVNPKWHYCICGFEWSTTNKTYEGSFGDGAPVFAGTDVVGIAVATAGSMKLNEYGTNYNIFTLVGPYLSWMNNIDRDKPVEYILRSKSPTRNTYFSICLILSNAFNYMIS